MFVFKKIVRSNKNQAVIHQRVTRRFETYTKAEEVLAKGLDVVWNDPDYKVISHQKDKFSYIDGSKTISTHIEEDKAVLVANLEEQFVG